MKAGNSFQSDHRARARLMLFVFLPLSLQMCAADLQVSRGLPQSAAQHFANLLIDYTHTQLYIYGRASENDRVFCANLIRIYYILPSWTLDMRTVQGQNKSHVPRPRCIILLTDAKIKRIRQVQ